uniref:Uncharacterized protein n=1 Tax=Rhizophora mucronata TaxID=61149 RepID=A0A2P2P624_RHIMU
MNAWCVNFVKKKSIWLLLCSLLKVIKLDSLESRY